MEDAAVISEAAVCAESVGYWGYHLILDCSGCDRAKIGSRENLDAFIKALVIAIDMKAYGEPTIEHFATHDAEKAGYSLVQLIETSSITGHFVDKNGDAYIDVFSCKPFDSDVTKKVIKDYLGAKKIKMHFLTRQA